jgi:hypothetical protein
MIKSLSNYWDLALQTIEQLRPGTSSLTSSAEWLAALRPTSIELYQSYRKDDIQVDYQRPEVQDAYLLRYFFPYCELSYQTFGLLEGANRNVCLNAERIVLFGGGPGPEIVGLLEWKATQPPQSTALVQFIIVDKAAESWEWWHRDLEKFLNTTRCDFRVEIIGSNECCSPQEAYNFGTPPLRTLFVAQNLLNEFSELDGKNWIGEILNVLNQSEDCGLLVVGATNYPTSSSLYRSLEHDATSRHLRTSRFEVRGKIGSNGVPAIIREHFHNHDQCRPLSNLNDRLFEGFFVEGPTKVDRRRPPCN